MNTKYIDPDEYDGLVRYWDNGITKLTKHELICATLL